MNSIVIPSTFSAGAGLNISSNVISLADKTQGDVLYYGSGGTPAWLGAGTSGNKFNTGGTGANPSWSAVSVKEIKTGVATWTTAFNTSSTSYTDITSATVTITGLSSGKTYTIEGIANMVDAYNATSNAFIRFKMIIGSTNVNETTERIDNGTEHWMPRPIGGMLRGQTSITEITVKCQVKISSGTVNVNKDLLTASLMVTVTEE